MKLCATAVMLSAFCVMFGRLVNNTHAAAGTAAGLPAEGSMESFIGEPRYDLTLELARGRYTIDVAVDGTLLKPTADGMLLSKDGGETWEPVKYSGGGIPVIDEKSGDVLMLGHSYRDGDLDNPVDQHDPEAGYYFPVCRSRDNGRTWEREKAIYYQDENGWLPSGGGAENGITLRHGPKKGRLLMPARVFVNYENRGEHFGDHYNMAIYSDDGGETWQPSAPFPETGTGEGTLAELSDGRVYYNSRSHIAKDAMRREAWSHDGGETWQDLRVSGVLPDRAGRNNRAYGNKGGLVRLPVAGEDILIYSNIDIPVEQNYRSNITVWVSFDGGETWPVKRSLHSGRAQYSMLAAGRPDTPSEGWIYLCFETRNPHYGNFARFNLSWLLEGEETGNGKVPDWAKGQKR